MNILLPMGITAGVLILGGTVAWGWPGIWCLTVLFPALIIGGTVGHLRSARQGLVPLRPGILAIGAVMGFGGIIVSGALFAAAAAPEWVDIAQTRTTTHPPARVWELAGNIETLPRWNTLITDTEPIGKTTKAHVEDRYQVTLNLEGRKIQGEIEVTRWEASRALTVAFKLQPGTEISDLSQSITLEKSGKGTAVTVSIRYRVPTVVGRAFNNFVVAPMFEGLTTSTVEHLVRALDD